MRFPPLKVKIERESNPLKSRILVRRLAVRAQQMGKVKSRNPGGVTDSLTFFVVCWFGQVLTGFLLFFTGFHCFSPVFTGFHRFSTISPSAPGCFAPVCWAPISAPERFVAHSARAARRKRRPLLSSGKSSESHAEGARPPRRRK